MDACRTCWFVGQVAQGRWQGWGPRLDCRDPRTHIDLSLSLQTPRAPSERRRTLWEQRYRHRSPSVRSPAGSRRSSGVLSTQPRSCDAQDSVSHLHLFRQPPMGRLPRALASRKASRHPPRRLDSGRRRCPRTSASSLECSLGIAAMVCDAKWLTLCLFLVDRLREKSRKGRRWPHLKQQR